MTIQYTKHDILTAANNFRNNHQKYSSQLSDVYKKLDHLENAAKNLGWFERKQALNAVYKARETYIKAENDSRIAPQRISSIPYTSRKLGFAKAAGIVGIIGAGILGYLAGKTTKAHEYEATKSSVEQTVPSTLEIIVRKVPSQQTSPKTYSQEKNNESQIQTPTIVTQEGVLPLDAVKESVQLSQEERRQAERERLEAYLNEELEKIKRDREKVDRLDGDAKQDHYKMQMALNFFYNALSHPGNIDYERHQGNLKSAINYLDQINGSEYGARVNSLKEAIGNLNQGDMNYYKGDKDKATESWDKVIKWLKGQAKNEFKDLRVVGGLFDDATLADLGSGLEKRIKRANTGASIWR